MAGDVLCRASKRRKCAQKAAFAPSAVHYVGYVEDDETPESIARKFEELERIEAAARSDSAGLPVPAADNQRSAIKEDGTGNGGATDGGLTEQQLMQVFKQTSIFTVSSAAANNESLLAGGALAADQSDTGCFDSDGLLATSDGEQCCAWDYWSGEHDSDGTLSRRQRDRKKHEPLPRPPRDRPEGSRQRVEFVTHYNASTQALIRRKVRVSAREDSGYGEASERRIQSWRASGQLHVPPELIRSGRVVAALDAAPCPAGRLIRCADLLASNWRSKEMPRHCQAVLINLGWVREDTAQSMAALSRLPMPRLCPVGFVFVWAPKQLLHAVVTQLYKWQFGYVESLTWVQLRGQTELLTLPSPCFRQSHVTLLMFRRTGLGKGIELRHQRNPDAIFDSMRKRQSGYGAPNVHAATEANLSDLLRLVHHIY